MYKYIYTLIFILILIVFVSNTISNKESKNIEKFYNKNKNKSKKKRKAKSSLIYKNQRDIKYLRKMLLDYQKKVNSLEIQLKLNKKNIELEPFAPKEDKEKLFNIEDEVMPPRFKKYAEISDNTSEEIKLFGKYSKAYMEEMSLEEEDLILNEDIDAFRKNWAKDGVTIYQYRDDKDRDVYRIYQKGNLLTMIDSSNFDILSQNRVNINASYKNKIKLDKKTGIDIKSNTSINLDQVNEDNSRRGKISMDEEGIRTFHTDKIVIKVGSNVIIVDKDSISIAGEDVNIFSSDTISLTSNNINISANKTFINSDVDILGNTNIYEDTQVFGSFIHKGKSFSSMISENLPITQLNLIGKSISSTKKNNILNIVKYLQFSGKNINEITDKMIKDISDKLDQYENQFNTSIKNEVGKIVDYLDIAKYKEAIEKKPENSNNTHLSSNLIMTPGKINISSGQSDSQVLGEILTFLQNAELTKVDDTGKEGKDESPVNNASDDLVKQLEEKLGIQTGNGEFENFSNIFGTTKRKSPENKLKGSVKRGLDTIIDTENDLVSKPIYSEHIDSLVSYIQNITDALQLQEWQEDKETLSSISIDYDKFALQCGDTSFLNANDEKINISSKDFNIQSDNMSMDISKDYNQKMNKMVMQTIFYSLTGEEIFFTGDKINTNCCENYAVYCDPDKCKKESFTNNNGANDDSTLLVMTPESLTISAETTGMGEGDLEVTGDLIVKGDSELNGDVKIVGDVEMEGPKVSISGECNTKGNISSMGNVKANNFDAPTANITQIQGNITNATNAVNATNAANAIKAGMADMAQMATQAAGATASPKCFGKNTKIKLSSGNYVFIKNLKVGQYINNQYGSFRVTKIHKIHIHKKMEVCIYKDNIIAQYHPINKIGWSFAKEKLPIINKFIDYYYNLEIDSLLPSQKVVDIDGLECCLLGWHNDEFSKSQMGEFYNKIWGKGWKNNMYKD